MEELEEEDVFCIDASGGDFSFFGELDGFALDVGEEAHFGESFEGGRDGGSLDAAGGGDIADAGFIFSFLQEVYGFEVIFEGGREWWGHGFISVGSWERTGRKPRQIRVSIHGVM